MKLLGVAMVGVRAMSKIFIVSALIILVPSACTWDFGNDKDKKDKSTAGNKDALNDGSAQMLSGVDLNGNQRSCPEVICSPDTSISSPPAAFTQLCANKGHVVKTCSCGDYICVDPASLHKPSNNSKGKPGAGAYTGYTERGDHVSCTPTGQEFACTAIYGPQEEFRDACIAAGHKAYVCGCHDYLCEEPLADK